MRLIDADRLIEELNEMQVEGDELYKGLGKAKLIVCYQPTVDAVPVVRCKDCKWAEDTRPVGGIYCNHPDGRNTIYCLPNDFCNCGEKR